MLAIAYEDVEIDFDIEGIEVDCELFDDLCSVIVSDAEFEEELKEVEAGIELQILTSPSA